MQRTLSCLCKSTSFSFSGCGWLIPYHLGVIDTLKSANILTSNSKVSGTSGGSISAAVAALGYCPKECLELVISLSELSGFFSNKDAAIREMFNLKIKPEDVLHLNHRLHVTVTQLRPTASLLIVNEFYDKEDLISCIAASCFVPLWSNPPATFTYFRGVPAIDGGIFAVIPPGDVKISPYSVRLRRVHMPHIAPHLLPPSDFPYTFPQLLLHSLVPPSRAICCDMFRIGSVAAEAWIEKSAKVVNDEPHGTHEIVV